MSLGVLWFESITDDMISLDYCIQAQQGSNTRKAGACA